MHALLVAVVTACLVSMTNAIGVGRLIVNTPSYVETCEPTTIRWYWTGSSDDAASNTVTVSVVSLSAAMSSLSRRSTEDRLIKRRLPSHSMQKRDGPVTININGASGLPMEDLTWTWNSVAVDPGMYRMAVTIDNVGLSSYSDDFNVTSGSDTSCLSSASSSSSSAVASSTSSSSLQPSSTSSADTNTSEAAPTATNSADSTNADANATTSSSQPQSTASTFSGATSSDESSSHSHAGKIAAGIIVPLAVIGALALFFFCFRKRNAENSENRRRAWSEKAFGGGMVKSQSTTSSFAGIHRRNASNMSGQSYAMRDAGQREMTEANMAGAGAAFAGENTDPSWVNFDGENDAHPLSPRGMQEIARMSTEQSRLPMEPSYFGASSDSKYPSFVPSRPAPQPQPLNNAQPQTSEVMLHRNGSQSSQELTHTNTTTTEELGRKNSAVRRKPVPVVSVIEDEHGQINTSPRSDDHSPFSDAHAASPDQQSPSYEVTVPSMPQPAARESMAPSSSRMSVSSQGTAQLVTVQRPTMASAPFQSPVSAGRSGGLPLPGRSLTGPRSVTGSDYGSPAIDGDHRQDAWKLSVQLGAEQDRGFRVSFPDVQNHEPRAL